MHELDINMPAIVCESIVYDGCSRWTLVIEATVWDSFLSLQFYVRTRRRLKGQCQDGLSSSWAYLGAVKLHLSKTYTTVYKYV